MVRKRFHLLIVILVLLLALVSFADIDMKIPCEDTEGDPPEYDCQILSDDGDNYYCDTEIGNCFLVVLEEPVVNETVEEPEQNLTVDQNLQTLQDSLTSLQSDLAAATSNIGTLSSDIPGIKQELATIQSSVNNLKNQISSVENQQNSISVGLAGLQQNIDSTKDTLQQVEESLDKSKGFTRFMTIIILVVVVIGVAGGVVFYTTKGKPGVNPEIRDYITGRIRSGMKFPQIKEELLKAGWSEKDIKWAYKETAKHNYGKFKGPAKQQGRQQGKVKGKTKSKKPGFAQDHRKMIGITFVVVLLLAGSLLVLRGISTGQAISFQRLIGGSAEGTSGKITYEVECTPPHILTPAGDACCLDTVTILDNGTSIPETPNGICDNIEERQLQPVQGQCIDNAQCNYGEYCINSQCTSLNSIYQGKGDCSKLCNYYTLHISTSDGESYNVKPKKGSYTAAGALEWKILEMPDHCKGEPAIVPVNIIKKKTGSILNEHVILLRSGQTSQPQTHPEIPGISFTLKVDEIFEICSE